MNSGEILALMLVVGLMPFFFAPFVSRHSHKTRPILFGAMALHVVAALGQVWTVVYFYGGGDLLGYLRMGTLLAETVRSNPYLFDDLLLGTVGLGNQLPVIAYGSTTAHMRCISAVFMLATGNSLYASCALAGFLALTAKAAIFLTISKLVPTRFHVRVALAIYLVPSVAFWTAGLMKESIAFTGLGWAFWGFYQLFFGEKKVLGGALLVAGVLAMGAVKPYVLLPFFTSAFAWYLATRFPLVGRGHGMFSSLRFAVGAAIATAAILALVGAAFPRFATDNLASETANLQHQFQRLDGGSTYEMGGLEQQSYSAQLTNTPVALFSALFRPVIFEAHNLTSLISAIEMTIVTFLILFGLYRRGLVRSVQLIVANPLLLFCVSFTILFGVGVGLAAPNLGSLSRYRIPMVPFYLVGGVLLVPHGQKRAAESS